MSEETIFEANRKLYQPGSLVRATSWNGSAFVGGLCALAKPSVAVEIGCGGGATSIYLAEALKTLDSGYLWCYDADEEAQADTREALRQVWPGGRSGVYGDFFEAYKKYPVDFAFIDLEPKSRYVEAFEHLVLTDNAVVVAHDATHGSFVEDLSRLNSVMIDQGWLTLILRQERGFLIGRRA